MTARDLRRVGLQRAVVATRVAVSTERRVVIVAGDQATSQEVGGGGSRDGDEQIDNTVTKWHREAANGLSNALRLVLDVTYHCGLRELFSIY